MKKQLSAILSIMMSANLLCVGALAEEASDEWKNNTGEINLTELTATGSGISISDNTVTITEGGDFIVSGTLADGMIYVNTESRVKLRLNGAEISNADGPAIFFDNVDKGFITICKDTQNFLSDGKEYSVEEADAALFSNDDLEIKGDGTLTITGNYKHAIAGDDDVTIENGILNLTSYEHSIKVNDTLSITGGTITATAETGKAMKAGLELIIDDGTFDLTSLQSEGIESKGILTINGGDLKITASDDGMNTGNEDTTTTDGTQNVQQQSGAMNQAWMTRPGNMKNQEGMTPPEGMILPEDMMRPENMIRPESMTPPEGVASERTSLNQGFNNRGGGGGFGRVDEETAQAHAITINGGKIYINTQCDGIDSNGHLTINGGEVIIDGPAMGGNGPLDAQGNMTVTGGTVITTSAAGMIQNPNILENVKLVQVNLSQTQQSGTKISITNDDNELMSTAPENNYQTLIFISENLSADTKYSVLVNDEAYEAFTITDVKTTVGTSNFGRDGGFGGGQFGRRGQRQNRISVSLNGRNLTFDSEPVIKNDTTLVGFRAILEALGAEVSWDEETQTVTATKDDVVIILNIGSNTAYINDKAVTLLAAPEIINNSTMIPVRFVSESLDMNVDWDENTRQVIINSK